MKPPSDEACAAYVASLDAAALLQARAIVDSILRGVDSSQDVDKLVYAIERAGRLDTKVNSDLKRCDHEKGHLKSRLTARNPVASAPTAKVQAHDQDRPWIRDQGVHIYAGKTAMKVELDLLRAPDGEAAKYTVQIELAPSSAPRVYDWHRKVAFQFTRRELPLLAAMLMGFAGDALVLTNHGPDHDKRLEIHQQGNKLFVKIRQGGTAYSMPVEASDVFAWTAIAMTALKKNNDALDSGVFLEMLKRTGEMLRPITTNRTERT